MPDQSPSWTKTFTRDTSKDIYEEVSYDTTKPKFDVVVIKNDTILSSMGTNTNTCFVYWDIINNNIGYSAVADAISGTTPKGGVIYNTSTNEIRHYSGDTMLNRQYSFPLAVVTRTSGIPKSLDQIFNGFGYIGSTVFALPGVKGLIPNGRNADGSLKNIEFSYTSVTMLNTVSASGDFEIYSLSNVLAQTASVDYYKNENFNIDVSGEQVLACKSINISTDSSGKITSFTPKTAFYALDYNDKSEIIGWGAPDYSATLSGVGNNYTAPSDGIFWFSIGNNNGARSIGIIPHGSSQVVFTNVYNSYGTSGGYQVYLAKGDRIIVTNSDTGLASSYFIPLKGAN